MLLRMRRRGVDPRIDPMREKIAVLMLAPQSCPIPRLPRQSPRARLPDVRREIARLRRGQMIALDAAGRNQQMRVKIGALALQIAAVRRMNVELNRKPLGDKMLQREGAREFDPVFVGNLGVRRQRHDDFAGDLGILATLRRLRRVPQSRGVREFRIGAFRQQHLVVLGRVAVLKVENLARALVADLGPRVIGRRARRRTAGASRDVARSCECDGHLVRVAQGVVIYKRRCGATHIASAHPRSAHRRRTRRAVCRWCND